MGLHRDIYWLGHQWSVTGFGMQAIDQRLKGAFDIEAALLWDDEVSRRMRALTWINAEDFDKALAVARKRFSEPSPKSQPGARSVLDAVEPAPAPTPEAMPSMTGWQQQNVVTEHLPSALPPFELQAQGRLAHFLPQWRIRSGA
jgi:hypothetical protein